MDGGMIPFPRVFPRKTLNRSFETSEIQPLSQIQSNGQAQSNAQVQSFSQEYRQDSAAIKRSKFQGGQKISASKLTKVITSY
ncbi:hypothetical protein CHS0354_025777 [Potamilus streckersoni]|uniref:Uncharacterized protein n=1 Tax=Potamilus streckersoni TaxID=2493646 RepID=A0AAE0TCT1_9BIVA|nr:hypothetical protein CHS0354_025777 [Potamilus streckersoni]